jgi:hypothetical protein
MFLRSELKLRFPVANNRHLILDQKADFEHLCPDFCNVYFVLRLPDAVSGDLNPNFGRFFIDKQRVLSEDENRCV